MNKPPNPGIVRTSAERSGAWVGRMREIGCGPVEGPESLHAAIDATIATPMRRTAGVRNDMRAHLQKGVNTAGRTSDCGPTIRLSMREFLRVEGGRGWWRVVEDHHLTTRVHRGDYARAPEFFRAAA